MTYSKTEVEKCGAEGCNERAVVVIKNYGDVSSLNTNGRLHVSNTSWCKEHAPLGNLALLFKGTIREQHTFYWNLWE